MILRNVVNYIQRNKVEELYFMFFCTVHCDTFINVNQQNALFF